MESNTESTA